MKRLAIIATIIVAALGVSVTAWGAAAPLSATSFAFDPGNTGTVAAGWVKHLGEPDPNDPGDTDRYGLLLSKNTDSSTFSAAGATLHNVRGIHLTELGYDIRVGGHCGAGAPRYNVVTTDNVFHFVGGCSNGTITPATPEQGWSRVRFNPTSVSQAFPPLTLTETIKSIDLLFDEGTELSDHSGLAVVDNLDVSGTLIGAPSEAS